MEGIDQLEPRPARASRTASHEPPAVEWRLVERWIMFFFGVVVIGVTVLALGLAAFVVRG